MFPYFFSLIASLFETIAILILFWGGVLVTRRLLVVEWHHIQGKADRVGFEGIRVDFGQRIVLAIEFLIAADLAMTVLNPSLDELLNLGVIVVIRTVLSYFLTKEVDRHEGVWRRT